MGQKTHPTGFRVGIIKPWLSTWYAKVKDYAGFVAEDAKIRKYIKKKYVVGVDIGGQTTKIGIVDRRGNIVVQTVINSKYKAGEAGIFIQSVCDTIRELAKEVGFDQIQGIGIGAPNGNYYKGTIEDASHGVCGACRWHT